MNPFSRLFGKKEASAGSPAPLFLNNTLTRTKELFIPLKPGVVTLYSCGPTVYSRQHIGNLRAVVFSDTLARTLEADGYRVRRVINITDVGHLTSDEDEGEDKMTLAAKSEKLSPEKIAERYTDAFMHDINALEVDTKEIFFPHATAYIREQISLARTLEEKGFAYKLPEGLYFDTSRFATYGKLGNVAKAALKEGARVKGPSGKRHPADFALWRSAKPGDLQQWDSPWGRGNPGWHIECSAMARALLGIEIDIHTGGEEHVAVHHNNEIAQSEAASGRTFARYWMHNAHLTLGGEKISKSLGNVVYLSDIVEKGFHPLVLRYFFLQAQYRTTLSFSWDALAAAGSALTRLWNLSREIAEESKGVGKPSDARDHFLITMRDDLATPQALGILWDTLKSDEYTPEEKWGLIETADEHFALMLTFPPAIDEADLPEKIQELLAKRENARTKKEFDEADRLRAEIEAQGYQVDDGPDGPVVTKI